MNSTYTITFGDQAENHKGMQKIGNLSEDGFNEDDLLKIKKYFSDKGANCEIINIHNYASTALLATSYAHDVDEAYILVIRNGLNFILNNKGNSDDFYKEQCKLTYDTKAFMYGRVVNKKARSNLCFGNNHQQANYEEGKGTIIDFNSVPLLNYVRLELEKIIGDKAKELVAEGNYYYDTNSCGIGYHGDSERRKVIAVRVGSTIPLVYHWFYKSNSIGTELKINLNHGDVYIMSEKAVGQDWKLKNTPTLRHAAGAEKFYKL